jgi:hypothetical protein
MIGSSRIGRAERAASFEGHRARDLERHFGAVHVVVAAEDQLDLHVDDGIAGQDAGLERFLDARLDRPDELAGDDAAHDLVLEDEAGARGGRLEVDDHVAVLALAARLPDELPFDLLDPLG